MANSLKNISGLLSPKFLSPRLSPNYLLASPKSEGNRYKHKLTRSVVAKKLDFVTDDKFLKVPSRFPKNETGNFKNLLEVNSSSREDIHNKSLELNTPNKVTLFHSGLGKLKKRTTILGTGTFGTVFQGIYKGTKVAVKVVAKETSNNEKNALLLSHPNIVKTLNIITNPEFTTYNLIIMEHLPKCITLQDVLESCGEKYDSLTLKKFAVDITTGLDYCHSNNVLHLDLKPKNILVDQKNTCKICDFGNSVSIGDNLSNFKHNGTVIYTAPELLLGKSPSMKSDIYSLGIIFWQIKYRKTPFEAYDSNESIIYNVAKHNIRPTCDKNNEDLFTNIFTKCWNTESNIRPNTCDILKDLEHVQI
ncbi:serine/threonine-protein kinase mos [Sitophilus oryzae]|uniref:non-specific serine/threonine protein kinase n=1 Tax=Sitophilus oryzae TaxID=7048 RepID=A0A6J2YBW8_SITOR|nr:serine/threonine-protein kinase mos [Sitophilus oryzae]